MPIMTLWRAIRRARCAIMIASPTRSSRSVRMTTSAASDEALAPRAPSATPISATASAGASLMPSPTMMVGCSRCSSAHRLDLVRGNAVSQHGIEVERCSDCLRRCGTIACDHDHSYDARIAQQPDRSRRISPQLVGQQQRTRSEGRPRRQRRSAPSATMRAGLPAAPTATARHVSEATLASPRLPGGRRSGRTRPVPMVSLTCSGALSLRPRSTAAETDGLGEDVMRGLLKRGPKREDLVRIFPPERLQPKATAHLQP